MENRIPEKAFFSSNNCPRNFSRIFKASSKEYEKNTQQKMQKPDIIRTCVVSYNNRNKSKTDYASMPVDVWIIYEI